MQNFSWKRCTKKHQRLCTDPFNNYYSFFYPQVSRNYRLAISKALRETLEYLDNGTVDDPEAFKLLDELSSDEDEKPIRSIEFIEEQLKKYRQKREELGDSVKKTIIKQLTTFKGLVKDEL